MIALPPQVSGLKSCIYQGSVFHHRHGSIVHRFRKRLYMLYLDLNELDRVFDHRWLWSTNRAAVARFNRADHVGESTESLRDTICRILQKSGHDEEPHSIGLLTQLRNFGFVFNPLSLFYCHNQQGELTRVVAEVRNTPWLERHCYVLKPEQEPSNSDQQLCVAKVDKEFHVSPFMPMDMNYRWRFDQPSSDLTVQVENWQYGTKRFEVGMQLRRLPITASNLAWMLIKYPLMPQQTVASIYWQALRLWLKKVPVYTHPKKLAEENRPVSQTVELRD